jgi:hypothetical protein
VSASALVNGPNTPGNGLFSGSIYKDKIVAVRQAPATSGISGKTTSTTYLYEMLVKAVQTIEPLW